MEDKQPEDISDGNTQQGENYSPPRTQLVPYRVSTRTHVIGILLGTGLLSTPFVPIMTIFSFPLLVGLIVYTYVRLEKYFFAKKNGGMMKVPATDSVSDGARNEQLSSQEVPIAAQSHRDSEYNSIGRAVLIGFLLITLCILIYFFLITFGVIKPENFG